MANTTAQTTDVSVVFSLVRDREYPGEAYSVSMEAADTLERLANVIRGQGMPLDDCPFKVCDLNGNTIGRMNAKSD